MNIPPTQGSYSMTGRDYIKVLFRQKWVIFVAFLTVAVSTGTGLKFKTPVYEAQVKMLISAEKQVESPYYREMLGGRNVDASVMQSEMVKSKPVLERAVEATKLYARPLDYERQFASPLKQRFIDYRIKDMNLDQYDEKQRKYILYRLAMDDLRDHIKVEPVRDTNLFLIKVTDFSPVGAAIIANVVSRSFVIFDLEQQYVELQAKYAEKNPIVVQLKETIDRMVRNLNGQQVSNIEAIGPASVKIVEQAVPPLKPQGLSEMTLFVLALVMGLFLGILLAFVFEYVDQTFRSKPDLENWLNLPVIACVNRKKGWGEGRIVRSFAGRPGPRATSYRILAQQLIFLSKTKKLKSLFFANIAEGKESSILIANVAKYLAEVLKLRVLLVDANLRHPQLHKLFKVPGEKGLADILQGGSGVMEGLARVGSNLEVLPAGHPQFDPAVLLDADSFRAFLAGAKEVYDLVLIDGADLRDQRDSALIAPAADSVILVIGESSVRRQVVEYSIRPLRENHAKLLGAVMSNRHYVIPKFLYENV